MRPSDIKNQEKEIYSEMLKKKLMGLLFVAIIVAFIFAVNYLRTGGGR